MKKIRVLYLSLHGDLSRGGQRSLLHLLRNLDRERVEGAVVMPHPGDLAEEVLELGMKVYEMNWPHFGLAAPVTVPFAMRRLRSFMKDFQPDILHADAPRNTHLAALVKGQSKLIIHLRVSNFDGLSDRILAREVDALVGVSHGAANRFNRYPDWVKKKIHVIYNGVNETHFHPADQETRDRIRKDLGLPVDRPLVGFLAGYVPVKRHDFFLDLWPDVVKEVGAVMLALAGQGPKKEKKRLQQRVLDQEMQESVTFLPFLEKPEEFLPACDLLVLPSELEGFPRVVIEAGACGVPVVASDIAGSNEGVAHNETGYIVPLNDREKWISSLVDLLKDREKRERFGKAARERVVNNFTIRHHAEKMVRLYEELADTAV